MNKRGSPTRSRAEAIRSALPALRFFHLWNFDGTLSRRERPLETPIRELSYRKGSTWTSLVVAWGFAEVLPDQVRVLAETAERAGKIDLERATRSKERAEERLKKGSEVDYARATIALERAIIRIQVGRKNQPASV